MGDFNVTCGISNLSINYGDRVGLVVLIPTRLSRGYADSRVQGSMFYIGPCDYFTPFGASVYGTYDSYGSIENIERTASVEFLEGFFGKDIETIINCVSGDARSLDDSYNPIHQHYFSEERKAVTGNGYAEEDMDNVNLLQSCSGMFFLRDVYEAMASKTVLQGVNYIKNDFNKFKKGMAETSGDDASMEMCALFHGYSVERYWGVPERGMKAFDAAFASFDELLEIETVTNILHSVNRMFQPSPSGEQYGNNGAMLNLLNVSKKITKSRMKDEENEDD